MTQLCGVKHSVAIISMQTVSTIGMDLKKKGRSRVRTGKIFLWF